MNNWLRKIGDLLEDPAEGAPAVGASPASSKPATLTDGGSRARGGSKPRSPVRGSRTGSNPDSRGGGAGGGSPQGTRPRGGGGAGTAATVAAAGSEAPGTDRGNGTARDGEGGACGSSRGGKARSGGARTQPPSEPRTTGASRSSSGGGGGGGGGDGVCDSTPSNTTGSAVVESHLAATSAGSDWEMVSHVGEEPTPSNGDGKAAAASSAAGGEATGGAEESQLNEALEASSILQAAADAASALAPLLPTALRRAAAAEQEASRLRAALAEAKAQIEAMRAQQLRLTEGFAGEIRQRDAELAAIRAAVAWKEAEQAQAAAVTAAAAAARTTMSPSSNAAAASASASAGSTPSASSATLGSGSAACQMSTTPLSTDASQASMPEVLSFVNDGALGLDFDHSNLSLKIVSSVASDGLACGRIGVGDEVVSVCGAPARNMTWEEFGDALARRPVVVSVRRGADPGVATSSAATASPCGSDGSLGWGASPSSSAAAAMAAGPGGGGGLASRVRTFAGWTRAVAKSAARELEAAMAEDDQLGGECPEEAEVADSLEARNRPFYELVRTSMREAQEDALHGPGPRLGDKVEFERWLRNFHSERDDEWYANNHSRVYNAFRPHWDQVAAARQALLAS